MSNRLARKAFELRWRAKERIALRVRRWAAGPESIFPGDPRWDIDVHPTSNVTCRMIKFGGDPDVPAPVVGKFSGVHHTSTLFLGGLHHVDWVSTLHVRRVGGDDGPWVMPDGVVMSNGPIVIGNDVWITFEAMVMSGVTIGDGAVVAARSLVTKDVAPYEIVGGSPARHLGWRFDEPTREALLRIRWWDWPAEKIEAHRHEIDSDDVAGFVARHDPLRQQAG
jgi:hypothetical protein